MALMSDASPSPPHSAALVSDPRRPAVKRPVAAIAAELVAQNRKERRMRRLDGLTRPTPPDERGACRDLGDEHRLTARELGVGPHGPFRSAVRW
jgi:hypothetical protein